MNRPNQRVVYLNGSVVPESEARIPFRDRGMKFGDAVFDTTRTFGHDIFRLREKRNDLLSREGWGEQSTDNVLQAIEDRRSISLDRFIYALGIRQIGQATARLLARQYGSLEAWRTAMTAAAVSSARLALLSLPPSSQLRAASLSPAVPLAAASRISDVSRSACCRRSNSPP